MSFAPKPLNVWRFMAFPKCKYCGEEFIWALNQDEEWTGMTLLGHAIYVLDWIERKGRLVAKMRRVELDHFYPHSTICKERAKRQADIKVKNDREQP